MARQVGLASLQVSCQLGPCHATQGRASHLKPQPPSPCTHKQVGPGVSGILLPFCTGQQFCRKGVEAESGPSPASCSFLHSFCLLYLPKLLLAP